MDRYQEKTHMENLKKKMQDAPFVPLGVLGMVAAVGYGAYSYKHRGNQSTSVFLMHLRVRAQSMVVGAITLGVAYSLCREYLFKKKPEAVTDKSS